MFFSVLSVEAQTASDKAGGATWKKLEFLLGKWTGAAGEKDTPLGSGQGGFSFEPVLNGKIIVRRNRASYDSGAQHDDLMVIYPDAPNDPPRAIYFDTEGHVIRYNLTFPAANRVSSNRTEANRGRGIGCRIGLVGALSMESLRSRRQGPNTRPI